MHRAFQEIQDKWSWDDGDMILKKIVVENKCIFDGGTLEKFYNRLC